MRPERELDGVRWVFDSRVEVEPLNRQGSPGAQNTAASHSPGTVHVECGRVQLKARSLGEKLD